MRIVHLIRDLAVGGMEHLVVQLALAQQSLGHEVSIECIEEPGALADEAQARGLSVRAWHRGHGTGFATLRALARQLRADKAVVAHTHNDTAAVLGGLAAGMAGVRAIVNTRHGMGDPGMSWRRAGVTRLAQHWHHCIVYVCERARFAASGAARSPRHRVVYNGIDLAPHRDLDPDARGALRRELGLSGDTPIVGIVCRLTAAKNLALFTRVAAAVGARHPTAHFVVVGDGEQRLALEHEIATARLGDRVHLLGTRSDVPRILQGLDLFLLTSDSEGMPLVLIEASAAGLPVVTTDAGGSAEVVLHDATGLVASVGDATALADAVGALLRDRDFARRLGAAGRVRAAAEFSIDRAAERYLQLYEEISNGTRDT